VKSEKLKVKSEECRHPVRFGSVTRYDVLMPFVSTPLNNNSSRSIYLATKILMREFLESSIQVIVERSRNNNLNQQEVISGR